MNNINNYRIKAQGVAVIEFALVLPLLLLLMLGTAEFGRVLYEYNTLTKAIRDGSRYLAGNALNTAGVIAITDTKETIAKNYVVYGNGIGTGNALIEGLSTDDISIDVVDSRHIKVSANYTYIPIFSAGIPAFGFSDSDITNSFVFQSATTVRAL